MPKVSGSRADSAPGNVLDLSDHAEGADCAELILSKLSPREREVADLVAQGLSDREISSRLVISRRTAESHVAHILTKLGFSSRVRVAAYVARLP
jgi:DNA-binding NarL/FixJ family response regulator